MWESKTKMKKLHVYNFIITNQLFIHSNFCPKRLKKSDIMGVVLPICKTSFFRTCTNILDFFDFWYFQVLLCLHFCASRLIIKEEISLLILQCRCKKYIRKWGCAMYQIFFALNMAGYFCNGKFQFLSFFFLGIFYQ